MNIVKVYKEYAFFRYSPAHAKMYKKTLILGHFIAKSALYAKRVV